jgi:transcriptional regulator with XRE-family HTH domain
MSITLSVKLGRKLRGLRERRGWNQGYLAENAGIGRAHLSQIENGAVAARIDTLAQLAAVLGISLADLFKDL